jgi:hypothetical protein
MRQFIAGLTEREWVCVDLQVERLTDHLGVRSMLIPVVTAKRALRTPNWGLYSPQNLAPGCIKYPDGRVAFHRFGNDQGFEPLVHHREFNGIRPASRELSEDFRLFHNLFFDVKNSRYTKVLEDGEEVEIVRISPDEIFIRAIELKQFLAIRGMKLAVLFDLRRRYDRPLAKKFEGKTEETLKSEVFIFHGTLANAQFNGDAVARVLGKKLAAGYAKKDSDYWPYSEDRRLSRKYPEFIIDVDDRGREVLLPCDPHGGHYLTPVYFKAEVLNRYYDNPSKYAVRDGHLSCGSLWEVQIDNDNPDYVIVFLGDIGRDIPGREHGYWKSFNIPPTGPMSETAFRRSFMAEFANPRRKDLLFKHEYSEFSKAWSRKHGWELFRPLSAADSHCFKSLRIPGTDQQNEFDSQIMYLAKLIVDSLNEAEIGKRIPSVPDQKGIAKLEVFLKARLSDPALHIEFLRDLQSLRSTGSAHLKSATYEKIARKLGLYERDPRRVFEELLDKAIGMLYALNSV